MGHRFKAVATGLLGFGPLHLCRGEPLRSNKGMRFGSEKRSAFCKQMKAELERLIRDTTKGKDATETEATNEQAPPKFVVTFVLVLTYPRQPFWGKAPEWPPFP